MPSYYFFAKSEDKAAKQFLLHADTNNANPCYGTFESHGLTLAKSGIWVKSRKVTKALLSDIARCYRLAEKNINDNDGYDQQDVDDKQLMLDLAARLISEIYPHYRFHQKNKSDQYNRGFYRSLLNCCSELIANGYDITDRSVLSQMKIEILCASQFAKIYSCFSDEEQSDESELKEPGCMGISNGYSQLLTLGSDLWSTFLSVVAFDPEVEHFRDNLQGFLDEMMPNINKAAKIVCPTSQYNIYAANEILKNLEPTASSTESNDNKFEV